jgi:Ca2+-binding EF-hand superfamily protein
MNALSFWQTGFTLLLLTALAAAQDAPRDGGRRDGSRDGNSGDRAASSASKNNKENRLVPGFGEPEGVTAVPGFGPPKVEGGIRSRGIPLEDRYTQAVIRYVDGVLQRYDRDRSRALERSEWGAVSWRSDPVKSDTNGDGNLSREELCERIKDFDEVRGVAAAQAKGGANTNASANRQKLEEAAKSLMARYDANNNGVIDQDEVKRLGGYYQNADTNGDTMISREELVDRSAAYAKSDGAASSSASAGSSSAANKPTPTAAPAGESYRVTAEGGEGTQRGYRPRSDIQRLPKGLPDWFTRNDGDGDGQIAMAEFAAAWTDAKLAEFRKYDADSDGVITPDEYLASSKRSLTRP